MVLREWVRRHLTKYPPGIVIMVGTGLVLFAGISGLMVKIYFSGTTLSRHAMDEGQMAIVHIGSGTIDGNVRHTQHSQVTQASPTPPVNVKPAGDISVAAPQVPQEEPAAGKEALAPAPLDSLTEQSDRGIVPITGRDGTVSWKYYGRPYIPPTPKKPLIAIILTNLALSPNQTRDAINELPHTVTLSFSPYASDARIWAAKARGEGFEALVDMPLEPENFPISDPGPYGLLDDLSPSESSNRLKWVLSRFPGFTGALGSENEKLTRNLSALRPTLTELNARGVLFVYVKTQQNSAIADLGKSRSAIVLGVDKIIDEEIDQTAMENQLQALVDLAKTQGEAIGLAHSYPPTLDVLQQWTKTLSDKGVDLVPVSAIAKQVYP